MSAVTLRFVADDDVDEHIVDLRAVSSDKSEKKTPKKRRKEHTPGQRQRNVRTGLQVDAIEADAVETGEELLMWVPPPMTTPQVSKEAPRPASPSPPAQKEDLPKSSKKRKRSKKNAESFMTGPSDEYFYQHSARKQPVSKHTLAEKGIASGQVQ